MMVFVRGRTVVMLWVIMSDVLVDVQRRAHGRRRDHGLDEHEGEQPAHAHSLLRALFMTGRPVNRPTVTTSPARATPSFRRFVATYFL